jgi:hypothetical protein
MANSIDFLGLFEKLNIYFEVELFNGFDAVNAIYF